MNYQDHTGNAEVPRTSVILCSCNSTCSNLSLALSLFAFVSHAISLVLPWSRSLHLLLVSSLLEVALPNYGAFDTPALID
jgi:hypothetical protein